MTDLVAFLTARLDEEQAALESIEDHSEPWRGEWVIKAGTLYTYNGWCLAVMPRDHPWNPQVLEHVVRWDPARVLAEIAAKRAVLGLYAAEVREKAERDARAGVFPGHDHIHRGCLEALETVIGHLVDAYVDHPEHPKEWRT